jgi:hypothetical protein
VSRNGVRVDAVELLGIQYPAPTACPTFAGRIEFQARLLAFPALLATGNGRWGKTPKVGVRTPIAISPTRHYMEEI